MHVWAHDRRLAGQVMSIDLREWIIRRGDAKAARHQHQIGQKQVNITLIGRAELKRLGTIHCFKGAEPCSFQNQGAYPEDGLLIIDNKDRGLVWLVAGPSQYRRGVHQWNLRHGGLLLRHRIL